MKKLFKETRSNPRSSGTAGLHFIAVLESDGKSSLHVFDSEDQAGLYHGQLRGYGGIKRIGRAKGSGKLTMDYIIEATAKQFGSKPKVVRHDVANNPVKPHKGWKIQTASSNGWADVKSGNGGNYKTDYYTTKAEAQSELLNLSEIHGDPESFRVVPASTEADDDIYENPVKPRKGESERDFISRCMSEEKKKFPNQKQRIAVCLSKARRNPFPDRNADE